MRFSPKVVLRLGGGGRQRIRQSAGGGWEEGAPDLHGAQLQPGHESLKLHHFPVAKGEETRLKKGE
jgi:hypothetical protein